MPLNYHQEERTTDTIEFQIDSKSLEDIVAKAVEILDFNLLGKGNQYIIIDGFDERIVSVSELSPDVRKNILLMMSRRQELSKHSLRICIDLNSENGQSYGAMLLYKINQPIFSEETLFTPSMVRSILSSAGGSDCHLSIQHIERCEKEGYWSKIYGGDLIRLKVEEYMPRFLQKIIPKEWVGIFPKMYKVTVARNVEEIAYHRNRLEQQLNIWLQLLGVRILQAKYPRGFSQGMDLADDGTCFGAINESILQQLFSQTKRGNYVIKLQSSNYDCIAKKPYKNHETRAEFSIDPIEGDNVGTSFSEKCRIYFFGLNQYRDAKVICGGGKTIFIPPLFSESGSLFSKHTGLEWSNFFWEVHGSYWVTVQDKSNNKLFKCEQ